MQFSWPYRLFNCFFFLMALFFHLTGFSNGAHQRSWHDSLSPWFFPHPHPHPHPGFAGFCGVVLFLEGDTWGTWHGVSMFLKPSGPAKVDPHTPCGLPPAGVHPPPAGHPWAATRGRLFFVCLFVCFLSFYLSFFLFFSLSFLFLFISFFLSFSWCF